MAKRVYPSARERILDAAERVLVRGGPRGLTVEAVIAEAKISRGGFFYHFATKDELIGAIFDRLCAEFAADRVAAAGRDRAARGRQLRACVNVSATIDRKRQQRFYSLILALIVGATESPALVAKVRAMTQVFHAEMAADDLPPAQCLLVQLALDALWLHEALGTLKLPKRRRREVFDLARALTRTPVSGEKG